jgi:8-oxo-dGTP pyrophosphatase MutT (NUDIX family)
MNIDHRRQVAIAILHQDGKFLLQLRDNIPGIFYPGCWALFGGHIESGESSDVAIQRELLEEIGYAPPLLKKFSCYADAQVIRHVYEGELTVGFDQLVLHEGWDMDLLKPEEIFQGHLYSNRAGQIRPLGIPHQKILLDYIQQRWYYNAPAS